MEKIFKSQKSFKTFCGQKVSKLGHPENEVRGGDPLSTSKRWNLTTNSMLFSIDFSASFCYDVSIPAHSRKSRNELFRHDPYERDFYSRTFPQAKNRQKQSLTCIIHLDFGENYQNWQPKKIKEKFNFFFWFFLASFGTFWWFFARITLSCPFFCRAGMLRE